MYRVLKNWLLLVMCCASAICHAQGLPRYIPYTKEGKWGYCDTTGHVVIKAQWDSAGFFVGGRAIVKKEKGNNNSYCIINEKAQYLIPPERNWNGTWPGKSGADLNARNEAGLWGIIDTNNNELIHFEYDAPAGGYKYCRGFVYREDVNKWYLFASKKGLEGVIDDHNKIMVPFKYRTVFFPVNGASYYFYANNGPMHTCIIDTNGVEVVRPEYYDVSIQNSLGPEGINLKYFLIRTSWNKGETYCLGWQGIPPANFYFDTVYTDYYAAGNFRMSKKRGADYFELSNSAGKKMSDGKFGFIILCANKYFIYKPYGKELYGVMDSMCHVIVAPKLRLIQYLAPGYYLYVPKGSDLMGIMDSTFKVLLEPSYQRIEYRHDSIRVERHINHGKRDFCYKYIDPSSYKPYGDWVHDSVAEHKYIIDSENLEKQLNSLREPAYVCGSGRAEARRLEQEIENYALTHEHISKAIAGGGYSRQLYGQRNTTAIYEFTKDSLYYHVVKKVNAMPEYYLVRADKDKTVYYAVVDTGLNYIQPPHANYFVDYMHAGKKLYVVKRDSLYSFLDSNFEPAIPFQHYNIVSVQRINGELYAMGTMDSVQMTPIIANRKSYEIERKYRRGTAEFDSAYRSIDKRRDEELILKTLLKNGAIVSALQDYGIIALMPKEFLPGSVCFLVKNKKGKVGLVDLEGRTLFSKVSFM